jgi:GNAT superfamily N-acetyltransferase
MHIARVTSVTDELLTAFKQLMPQLTRSPVPTRAELESMLAAQSVLWIAREPDERGPIIGAATLVTFRSPAGLHAHIEDVVVDESMRGKGIGEALVQHLLDAAAQMGLKGVSLTCNPRREAADQLYQKMGFKKWETNVYWHDLG